MLNCRNARDIADMQNTRYQTKFEQRCNLRCGTFYYGLEHGGVASANFGNVRDRMKVSPDRRCFSLDFKITGKTFNIILN